MPGIKDIDCKIEHILSDWDESKIVPKKFSNTTLPIWNFGGSFLISDITFILKAQKIWYKKSLSELPKMMQMVTQ